jgi:hypothetical protein
MLPRTATSPQRLPKSGSPPVYRPLAPAVQSKPAAPPVYRAPVSPPVSRRAVGPVRAIQAYKILSGNRILNAMPVYKDKPWFGYPYAVVHGAAFPAQHIGVHPAPDEFLTAPNGNVANVVNHGGALRLRVSDDNTMAIEDSDLGQRQPKVFYATTQVVNAANAELHRLNSNILLQPGANNLSILTGWTATEQLVEVTPRYNGGTADNAPQNCDEMAARVLGIGSGELVRDAGTLASTSAWRIGGISEERYRELYNDRRITTEELENYQARRYVRNRDAGEVRRRQANENARPAVGDAFVIGTIGHGTDQGGGISRVRDLASGLNRDVSWSFHFGGVVAQSGGDRITLENYARGDDRRANADPRWYFQMYGEKRGQSFHEFFAAKPDYANPVTAGFVHPNR